MTICAYCGLDKPTTREHLMPAFLYQYIDRDAVGDIAEWNEVTKTRLSIEHKVKDVCAKCNNVNLSNLDAYGQSFLESNEATRPIYASRFKIRFDYHRLQRWILKIHFNASRASPDPLRLDRSLLDYILHGAPKPDDRYVFLATELLRPHRVQSPDSPHFASANADGLSNPFLVRITKSLFTRRVSERLQVDSVAFGGLVIHSIKLATSLTPSQARKLKQTVLRENQSCMKIMDPSRSEIILQQSDRDHVDFRRPQTERELSIMQTGVDPHGRGRVRDEG